MSLREPKAFFCEDKSDRITKGVGYFKWYTMRVFYAIMLL